MTYTSLEHLTHLELHQIYLNDYTGRSGFNIAMYLGKDGPSYKYMIALTDPTAENGKYIITDIWINVGHDNEPHLGYAGIPLFETDDIVKFDNVWNHFAKNHHMIDGAEIHRGLKLLQALKDYV